MEVSSYLRMRPTAQATSAENYIKISEDRKKLSVSEVSGNNFRRRASVARAENDGVAGTNADFNFNRIFKPEDGQVSATAGNRAQTTVFKESNIVGLLDKAMDESTTVGVIMGGES